MIISYLIRAVHKIEQNRILLIIACILFAIVVLLTIAVILKYIIRWKLKKGRRHYRPYDWYWILDCLFCQIQAKNEPMNQSETNPSGSESVEGSNQSGMNRLHPRNIVTTLTQ